MSLNPVLTQRKGKTGEHFNSSSIVLARLHLKAEKSCRVWNWYFWRWSWEQLCSLHSTSPRSSSQRYCGQICWMEKLGFLVFAFLQIANRNPQSAARSQVKEEIIEVADEAEVKSSPPPASGPAPPKSKKKPEKKTKEKDTFKHPWLVTSLKVCLNVFSECKNKFRATVGGWWILISAPMGGIWPLVQRIRLLWFGAPSKHRAASNHIILVHCREFSAREHKPLRCNVEFDHGLFVK